MEDLTYIKILNLFNHEGPEIEFLHDRSIEDGLVLEDFHISVLHNLSEDDKKVCVREAIDIWCSKGTEVFNL